MPSDLSGVWPALGPLGQPLAMFFWYLGLSWVAVWAVFRSPALDYRLVMAGAVLPVIELPFGTGPLHTLLAPVIVLTAVMVATQGKRLVKYSAWR